MCITREKLKKWIEIAIVFLDNGLDVILINNLSVS